MNRSSLLVIFLSGCCMNLSSGPKTGPTAPPAPATPGAPAPPPAPGPAKSGHVSGTIYGTDGRPLALKGAKVHVRVSGTSSAGANVSFSPAVDDGRYDLAPPHGLYHVTATMEYDWNGKHYTMELKPVQDNTVTRDSEKGFVQDFEWKIQGPRRTPAEPNNHTHWYGSTVSIGFQGYRNDISKPVPGAADGSKVVFTFTPVGLLMDGTQGKTVTFERTFRRESLDNDHCCDLPLGNYTITGVIQHADGKTQPALIQKGYKEFVASYDHVLEPNGDGLTGAWPRILGFTRDTP